MITSNTMIEMNKKLMPKIASLVSEWEPEEWVRNEIMMMNDFLTCIGEKKIINDKQRIELQYDVVQPMQAHYRNEDIYYATPLVRLSQYQIFPYDGKLYDCNGVPVNTTPLDFNTGAILVMTREGTLFLSHKERGIIHHSTLLASAPVAYSCMLEVSNGIIIKEAVWSGHYEPTQEQQAQFHDRLKRNCCLEIPQNLIPIFLSTVNNPISTLSNWESNLICPISRLPLIEPVKLPCGHVFNLSPFLKWHEKHENCPLDGRVTHIEEIAFDEDLFSVVKNSYHSNFSQLKSSISDLDSKVINFKLDDRNEQLTRLSTISNKVEVLLLVEEDSSLSRIYEIAKAIGCCSIDSSSKVRFSIDGFYRSEEKLSEIKGINNKITRVYLFKV